MILGENVIMWLYGRDQGSTWSRLMWLYGRETMKISYHPAKFCSHRNSDSRDIVALVCRVISQDHVSKESCDFIDSSPRRYVTILPSFGGQGHCGSGNIMILICHVILQDDAIKGSCDFWLYERESINVSYHPAKFGSHRHFDSGDIVALVCHVIS